MRYGLVGKTLKHSFSKEIHESLADYTYELFSLNEQEFDDFFTKKEFAAVNVTIPYKERVISFLDEIDPRAKKIGAVNTVVNKNGKLVGYNTDYDGVRALLLHNHIQVENKNVLVLGSGGTSKTVCAVLQDQNAAVIQVVSRTPQNGQIDYHTAKKQAHTQVIINTTPLGMYPHIDASPINLKPFANLQAVCDVVYNPLDTKLILQAKSMGVPACGGLYMLVAQAVAAIGLFKDTTLPSDSTNQIYAQQLRQKKNLVLTGMPGAGKTTIGKLLKKISGKVLVDLDAEIEKREGKSIPDIFAQVGEVGFRLIESQVVNHFAAKTGQIISTGGGVILKEENMQALSQNGVIIFLDRPLHQLTPGGGRPLSSDQQALKKRYDERYNKYINTSDIQIVNNKTPKIGAERTWEAFYEAVVD